jgi:hypothetical protein
VNRFRLIPFIVSALVVCGVAYATGKISDMTALGGAPASNDQIEIEKVTGGPLTRSITISNLFTSPTLTTPVLGVASATSVALTGTAGAGFEEYPTQASAPSAPASGFREYADSTGRKSWIRASDGFTRTWDATLTANRVYTLPDASGTLLYSGGPIGTPSSGTLTNASGLPAAGVVGTAATLGANTFTRGQTITQGTANESIIASTGGSNTGSNATSMLDYSWTLNTSGSPDVIAYRITDTARGATTKFFNIFGGASGTTSEFSVDRSGLVSATSAFKVTTAGSKSAPEILLGNQTTTGFFYRNSSNIGVALNGAEPIEFNNGALNLASDFLAGWTATAASGSGAAAALDAALSRDTTGIVQFNGGTAATTKGGFKVIADTTGSYFTQTSSTEQTTLGTGATTTATAGNLAVANSQIEAILLRITTAITTSANFTVKVTGGNVFCQIGTATTSNTTLTANTTYVMVPCAHADAYVATATTLTYTLNANPGAGVIRATVIYKLFSPPTS